MRFECEEGGGPAIQGLLEAGKGKQMDYCLESPEEIQPC